MLSPTFLGMYFLSLGNGVKSIMQVMASSEKWFNKLVLLIH